MNKRSSNRRSDPFVIWILLSIPVVLLAAAPLHFVYEWTGEPAAVGLFVPVNESVWEHLKLVFWPLLLWWIIGAAVFRRRQTGRCGRLLVSLAAATVVGMLFIVAFHYTYTGAFGGESLAVDIVSMILGLVAGAVSARAVYLREKPGGTAVFMSGLLLIAFAAAFIYWTFAPPHLPLFLDTPTGTYGTG